MEKLKSRKLWTAVLGVIAGVALAFGVEAEEISAVAGAVTAAVSVVSYIFTEGKIDAERVRIAAAAAETARQALTDK